MRPALVALVAGSLRRYPSKGRWTIHEKVRQIEIEMISAVVFGPLRHLGWPRAAGQDGASKPKIVIGKDSTDPASRRTPSNRRPRS